MSRTLVAVVVVTLLAHPCASAQSTARGRALCIGLNEVDPAHYGSPLKLSGCRNDAQDMATILGSIEGFGPPETMLDSKAKVADVTAAIGKAADELKSGDIFVLTIASHGAQLPDLNGDEAELDSTDRLDETWLLFDRMWVDDERYPLWRRFKTGVRIVVVSDTCHSGTTIRNPFRGSGALEMMNGVMLRRDAASVVAAEPGAVNNVLRESALLQSDDDFYKAFLTARSRAAKFPLPRDGKEVRDRGLGREVGLNTRIAAEMSQPTRSLDRRDALALYAARSDVYDPILQRDPVSERAPVDASVILLAACQDFQTAADGDLNGAFTGTLKEVWNEGFKGTYEEFLNNIKRMMYNRYYDQVPNYLTLGAADSGFQHKAQRPFSVQP